MAIKNAPFKMVPKTVQTSTMKKVFFIVEVPPVFIRSIITVQTEWKVKTKFFFPEVQPVFEFNSTFYYPIMDSLVSSCWIF